MAKKLVTFSAAAADRIAAAVRNGEGRGDAPAGRRRGSPLAHEPFIIVELQEALTANGTADAVRVDKISGTWTATTIEVEVSEVMGNAFGSGDWLQAKWHQQSQTWIVGCCVLEAPE